MKINFELLRSFKNLDPENRIHNVKIPIFAITGGIASGKSSLVEILKYKKYFIIEADSLIKKAYQEPSVLFWVCQNAPHVVKNNIIDFPLLRKAVFENSNLKNKLEKLLYSFLPTLFRNSVESFPNPPFIFYEVPLLFEKKLNKQVDLIITIYTPIEVQLKRLSERDKQTDQKTRDQIIKAQLPFELKEKNSHFIIENIADRNHLLIECDLLLKEITKLINP